MKRRASHTSKSCLVISMVISLLLCFSLVGCGSGDGDNASIDSTSNGAGADSQAADNQQRNTPDETEPQAPIVTTAYLQEGTFGDSNLIAFIVKQQEEEIVSIKVFYGNVEVSGNTTTKRSYTMNMATVEEPDAKAFLASFSSGEGSVSGSVSPSGLTGTIIIPVVGEFAVDASMTDSKQCTSCSGTGKGTGSSTTCSFCTGVGTLIAYKGAYI